MSCNQLMVLLSLYRGTFEKDKHTETLQQDLIFLRSKELIKAGNSLSKKGILLIETILDIARFLPKIWNSIED